MTQLLYDWQTLIAGGLGLAGGIIAYWGALLAAKRQVAAMQEQLDDARMSRAAAERREEHGLVWSLAIELRRVIRTAEVTQSALPSGPQWSQLSKANLVIESGPILRGERDISLLNDERKTLVEAVARRLAAYNVHIATRPTNAGGGILVDATLLNGIQLVKTSAKDLREILPEDILDPSDS